MGAPTKKHKRHTPTNTLTATVERIASPVHVTPQSAVAVANAPITSTNPYLVYVPQGRESDAVPAQVVKDRLPSIKTVHVVEGRDVKVVVLKCPVEIIIGKDLPPADLIRRGLNGIFDLVNEKELLSFDVQFVCS